ncbi:MAG: hypothetical protein Q9199_006190, partial [Rusavskia elegans]
MAYPSSPNLSNVPDLTSSPYYDTSLGSPSPSPRMMYSTFPPLSNSNSQMYANNNNHQILDPQYLARRAQQQQQQAAILASVEFTDLTNPVYEDRRRRRKSTTNQDKQAISNMGIVPPPSSKPRLATRLPRPQRKTRPAPRNGALEPGIQIPRPQKLTYDARGDERGVEDRGGDVEGGDQDDEGLEYRSVA